MAGDAAEEGHAQEAEKKGRRGSKRRLPGLINHVLRRRIVQCERDLSMRGTVVQDDWFSAVSTREQAATTAPAMLHVASAPAAPTHQQPHAVLGLDDSAGTATDAASVLLQLFAMEQARGRLAGTNLAVLAEQQQQQQQQQQRQQQIESMSRLLEQACYDDVRIKRRRLDEDVAASGQSVNMLHGLAQESNAALHDGAFGRLLSHETVVHEHALRAQAPDRGLDLLASKPIRDRTHLLKRDLVLPPLSQALLLLRQDHEPRPFAPKALLAPGLDAVTLNALVQDTAPLHLNHRLECEHEVNQLQALPLTQVQQHVHSILKQHLSRESEPYPASLGLPSLLTTAVM
jgi:hypothetical protein